MRYYRITQNEKEMSELEEDIKHCEEVLADWHGCDECKADHERLLSYMKELLEF